MSGRETRRRDIDGVRIEVAVGFGLGARDDGLDVAGFEWAWGRWATSVGRDVYFCGDGPLERVFIEGVEEGLQGVPISPDFRTSEDVNYEGKSQGEPENYESERSGRGCLMKDIPDDAVECSDA